MEAELGTADWLITTPSNLQTISLYEAWGTERTAEHSEADIPIKFYLTVSWL